MKDGTLTSEASIDRGDIHISFSYEAKWQVENGVLVETVTKSSNTNLLHVGYTTRDSILGVDNREFVFKTQRGEVVTRDRIP